LLWQRTLEDVRVNSLFQRLRRNLLLFLQLLAVGLAMLALLAPRVTGKGGLGRRYVILIDQSASMSATDVTPSRLEKAKALALELVDTMGGDDLAMVIAFGSRARVISPYTGDLRLLRQRIASIEPTQETTSPREALQAAAGLANPARQVGEGEEAGQGVTPRLYLYTDGGFSDVEDFSLGNLESEAVIIGPEPLPYETAGSTSTINANPARRLSDNLAILALEARTNEDQPGFYELFGRVRNYRGEKAAIEAELWRHPASQEPPRLADAITLEIPPAAEQSFKFDLPETVATAYEVHLKVDDALAVDNTAFAIVGARRKARILLATDGNRYLTDALKTDAVAARADVAVVTPEQVQSENIRRDLSSGRYDLVILDGVQAPVTPEANTLRFGSFPANPAFARPKEVATPIILDWDLAHPILQYVRDLSQVYVARGRSVELPAGARTLIEGDKGPMAFTMARAGYTDLVVTFPLLDAGSPNTTWFRYISFPMFILNAVTTLGNVREGAGEPGTAPGLPVPIRAQTNANSIQVSSADGRVQETVIRSPDGNFVFNHAEQTGLYRATWPPDGSLPFAVNLFDLRESDLEPRGLVPQGTPAELADSYKIKIGYSAVSGVQKPPEAEKGLWKPLAVLVLGTLLVEWYVYNRRVLI